MDEKDLLRNSRISTFLGYSIQQSWIDLLVWEKFLMRNTARSLVELGTGYCGMSAFLLLQCIQREMEFLTFDIKTNSRLKLPLSRYLGLHDCFSQIDIFEGTVIEDVIHSLQKPLILFCDDGNKRKEFSTFVPMLEVGDYVVVHDWGQEIGEKDVAGYPIEPILKEECEFLLSQTRFWRIK